MSAFSLSAITSNGNVKGDATTRNNLAMARQCEHGQIWGDHLSARIEDFLALFAEDHPENRHS